MDGSALIQRPTVELRAGRYIWSSFDVRSAVYGHARQHPSHPLPSDYIIRATRLGLALYRQPGSTRLGAARPGPVPVSAGADRPAHVIVGQYVTER